LMAISKRSVRPFPMITSAAEMLPPAKILASALCAGLCPAYAPGTEIRRSYVGTLPITTSDEKRWLMVDIGIVAGLAMLCVAVGIFVSRPMHSQISVGERPRSAIRAPVPWHDRSMWMPEAKAYWPGPQACDRCRVPVSSECARSEGSAARSCPEASPRCRLSQPDLAKASAGEARGKLQLRSFVVVVRPGVMGQQWSHGGGQLRSTRVGTSSCKSPPGCMSPAEAEFKTSK
jgi:hypothetical protein